MFALRVESVDPAGTVIGEAAGWVLVTWRPASGLFSFPSRRLRPLPCHRRVVRQDLTAKHLTERAATASVRPVRLSAGGTSSPGRTVGDPVRPGHCRRGVLRAPPVVRWIAFVSFLAGLVDVTGLERGDDLVECCSAFRFPRVVTCPGPARRRPLRAMTAWFRRTEHRP